MKKVVSILISISLMLMVFLSGCGQQTKSQAPASQSEKPKFPQKAITIVDPFAAGGAADITARLFAEYAQKELGQPVIVENREGASGAIGQSAGAHAAKDGYTLTLLTTSIVTNPIMNKLDYTYKSFEPICQTVSDPAYLAVTNNDKFDTWEKFLDYAKNNPGKVRLGSSGANTSTAIAEQVLMDKTGIKGTIIPFNGAALAAAAVMGGQIEGMVGSFSDLSSVVDTGKVKLILVLDNQRNAALKDVPTAKEKGVDVVSTSWRGIGAPAGTDPQILKILGDAFEKVVKNPEYLDKMKKANLPANYLNTADFKKLIEDDYTNYSKLLKK